MTDRELRLRRTIDRLRDEVDEWRAAFRKEQAAHRQTRKRLRAMQEAAMPSRQRGISERELFRAHGVST